MTASQDHPHLVVFDLVGTTILDRGEVEAALTRALHEEGRATSPADVLAVRGRRKREAIATLLSTVPADPAVGRTHSRFVELLASAYRESGACAVAGAAETLDWLRARGARVALTTGFERELTRVALAASGLSFDTVVCGDDVAQGRPAPYLVFRAMERTATLDVATVAVVGDTMVDLEAAANAGVRWRIGVCTGVATRAALAAFAGARVLDTIASLRSLWPDWG